jgi:hypothetical protein
MSKIKSIQGEDRFVSSETRKLSEKLRGKMFGDSDAIMEEV